MKVKKRFFLAVFAFLTAGLFGCGTNVYKGLESKSSADLKLCLDYGDYDCVLNNTSDSDTGYLKELRAKAKAGKAGFSLADVAAKAVTIDFSAQASASTNFTSLYTLTTGITDKTLFAESVKGLNDSNPTDSNTQFTVAVANAMNVSISVYSNYDTNKDGKLCGSEDVKKDPVTCKEADTALDAANVAAVATTWNNIKGSSASYNSGVLGNVQASIDFTNKAYASGATDASTDMSKAATDAQTQLNKVSGATNTDILNGILCLDGGTKSDGSACS